MTAFYLKYRPQKVSELDLLEIRKGLEKVLKSSTIPHAFLFAGPRGTGKTSAARIVAKAVNCIKRTKEAKSGFEPCNQCEICRSITDGSCLDLIEIDAASSRGIDDIRELRERIKLSPSRCRYKVYIIDEVHMLTTEAFNALLKTLEEPPAHAIFILCTTAPEKLPPTIISRCTRFNFQKAKPEEVMAALRRAVKKEKLKTEKGVLKEISKSVDGSFRDAHKILEQLSFGGKKISLKETKKVLGKIEALVPEKLLSLLAVKDVKASLLELGRVVETGADLLVYIEEVLEQLRLALLAKIGLVFDESVHQFVNKKEREEGEFSLEEIKTLIRLFSRAAQEIKTCPISQLPLELVIVEWCGEGSRKVGPNGESTNSQTLSVDSGTRPAKKLSPVEPSLSGKQSLEEIKRKWSEVLFQVRPLNHSVEALLRATRPIKVEGEILTLEVFYKFHKERLETEKCRSVVEEATKEVFGRPLKLKCVLGERKVEVKTSPQLTRETAPAEIKSEERATENLDILKIAEEIFGGT